MLIRSAIFPFVPSPSDRGNQGDWDADRIRGKNLRFSRLHLNWEKVYLNMLPFRKRALYDPLSWCFLWLVLLWQVLLSGVQSWIFYGRFYSLVSDINSRSTAFFDKTLGVCMCYRAVPNRQGEKGILRRLYLISHLPLENKDFFSPISKDVIWCGRWCLQWICFIAIG